MGLFGLFGYICAKLDAEPAPMLLGFIIGPMMEEYLRRALLLSHSNPLVFSNDLSVPRCWEWQFLHWRSCCFPRYARSVKKHSRRIEERSLLCKRAHCIMCHFLFFIQDKRCASRKLWRQYDIHHDFYFFG